MKGSRDERRRGSRLRRVPFPKGARRCSPLLVNAGCGVTERGTREQPKHAFPARRSSEQREAASRDQHVTGGQTSNSPRRERNSGQLRDVQIAARRRTRIRNAVSEMTFPQCDAIDTRKDPRPTGHSTRLTVFFVRRKPDDSRMTRGMKCAETEKPDFCAQRDPPCSPNVRATLRICLRKMFTRPARHTDC